MPGVLITDDTSFMRTVLKQTFEDLGVKEIYEASNGLEAIQMYVKVKPSLVTMDITMPVMDGIQAVKAIRSKYKDAVIIMVSAMGQQDMVRDAIISGAKDFIVKPFQKDKMLATIKKYLEI